MSEAETFTSRCRRMLAEQPDQAEFTLSRGGLETLVLDAERYGQANQTASELLLAAREIVAAQERFPRDSDAWLAGAWDHLLPMKLLALQGAKSEQS